MRDVAVISGHLDSVHKGLSEFDRIGRGQGGVKGKYGKSCS